MANIKSVNGNPIVLDGNGIEDEAVTRKKIDNLAFAEEDYAIKCATERTVNICTMPVGRYYASTADGIIRASSANYVGLVDLVPCEASTSYNISYVSASGNVYYFFYNSNRELISLGNSGATTANVTTPSECAFIYVHLYRSGGATLNDASMIQIVAGTTAPPNATKPWVGVDTVARSGLADMEDFISLGIERSRNVNIAKVGRWQIQATGRIVYAGDSNVTYFGMSMAVPVSPSTEYTVSLFKASTPQQCLVGEYDENGLFIVRTTYTYAAGVTFTTGSTTKYVAVQYYRSGAGITIASDSGIQIEAGESATAYERPYTFVDSVARRGSAVIPDYFLENVTQAEEKVRACLPEVGRHGDAFVFVTDVHWRNNRQNSPALVRHVIDNTGVMMVVNGGDNIQGHLTTRQGALDEIRASVEAFTFEKYGIRCMGVFGNHDNNRNSNADNPDSWLDEADQFGVINRAYGPDGLHYASSGNYYYYDNDVAFVRYMMLDWGADQTEQSAWIASVMEALPTGFKVVVVIHGIYAYNSSDPSQPIMERQYVLDAFEPFKDDVLFFIQGHTHTDDVIDAYGDGTPIIITTCDTFSTTAGSVSGTITEQAFDIVVFDYAERTIKCIRVGRGSDRTISMAT